MKKLLICLLSLLLITACTPANNNKTETLTVGMECNYAPFNWTQIEQTDTAVLIDGGQAGYCDGFDVAIARRIATELGKELIIKKIEWDGLPIAVNNDEIDLIIAGMTDTPDRQESLAFTTPYYESQMVLIVRKDSTYASATSISDFAGAKVIAQLNTFHDDIIDQITNVNHGTPLKSFPLLTVAVKDRDADAMVSELPVAISITNSNTDLMYLEFTPANGFDAGEDATVSIAMRKGNPDFLAQVQAALDSITKDERTQMMMAAIAYQPAE